MSRTGRTAAVSVVAIAATGTAGLFVHDRATALVCLTVMALSILAIAWSALAARRASA